MFMNAVAVSVCGMTGVQPTSQCACVPQAIIHHSCSTHNINVYRLYSISNQYQLHMCVGIRRPQVGLHSTSTGRR